jgi:hypothetical protein
VIGVALLVVTAAHGGGFTGYLGAFRRLGIGRIQLERKRGA